MNMPYIHKWLSDGMSRAATLEDTGLSLESCSHAVCMTLWVPFDTAPSTAFLLLSLHFLSDCVQLLLHPLSATVISRTSRTQIIIPPRPRPNGCPCAYDCHMGPNTLRLGRARLLCLGDEDGLLSKPRPGWHVRKGSSSRRTANNPPSFWADVPPHRSPANWWRSSSTNSQVDHDAGMWDHLMRACSTGRSPRVQRRCSTQALIRHLKFRIGNIEGR